MFKEPFLIPTLFCKMLLKDVKNTKKQKKTRYLMHLTPRCALCIPLRSRALWYASHRRVKLRSVHLIAESSSAVCFPLRSQARRCASHRKVNCTKYFKKLCGVHHCGVRLRGVHPSTESSSAVCIPLWSRALWCVSQSNCTLRSLSLRGSGWS